MMLGLLVTTVHVQLVLQRGCCWTAPDFTTACMYMYTWTALFTFWIFTLLSAVHHLRVASACGQWELSAAAKRGQCGSPASDSNKTPHPKTVQCKTAAVTSMSNKLPACCPQGRGQEDWRPKAGSFSINLLISACGTACLFLFFSLVLLTYLRKKALFHLGN